TRPRRLRGSSVDSISRVMCRLPNMHGPGGCRWLASTTDGSSLLLAHVGRTQVPTKCPLPSSGQRCLNDRTGREAEAEPAASYFRFVSEPEKRNRASPAKATSPQRRLRDLALSVDEPALVGHRLAGEPRHQSIPFRRSAFRGRWRPT